ncbi:MAG: extracellular elastinolytic metalloproteinase, partial [Saprospiraceae bacterium]
MKNKNILTLILCLCTAFLFAQSSFDIAFDYLQQSGKYTNSDLSDLSISDEYQSDHNGITHLYLQQRYQGL